MTNEEFRKIIREETRKVIKEEVKEIIKKVKSDCIDEYYAYEEDTPDHHSLEILKDVLERHFELD